MSRTTLFLAVAGALAVLALAAAPRPQQPLAAPTVTTVAVPAVPTVPGRPADAQTAAPAGGIRLTGKLASGYVANGGASNYLTVDIAAAELERESERTPANLVVVIDRSVSMSGQKMQDALGAARALVGQLGSDDRLGVVHYGSDVRALESTMATERGRRDLLRFIDGIHEDGSTNISGALEVAARVAAVHQRSYRTNRIILVSDGQPTVGVTDQPGLARIVSGIRERGFTVTSLGVGADFDERMMQALADAGGGFYGYLDDSARLAEVFARELDQASRMVARDLELRLEAPEGVRIEEVLGRSFTREGDGARLRLYDLSSGPSNRVVVRFSVSHADGLALPQPLRARLDWTEVRSGERLTAAVALTATVTSDPQRALDHADPEVLAHAANAEAARQMLVAAELARQGRREEADRHLSSSFGNIRRLFGSSASALAGSTLESSRADLRSGDMNRAAKSMDRKTMENFGMNNAY